MRFFFTVILTALLTGCANHFTFDGARYESKAEAVSAVRSKTAGAIAQIKPHTAPLVDKTLVVAVPTVAAVDAVLVYRARQIDKTSPMNEMARERFDYLAESANFQYRAVADALRASNIYKSVDTVEGEATPNIVPSPTRDVVSLYWPLDVGSAVWYFANVQNGRQVVAIDVSKPTLAERYQSLVDAVTAMALQR